MWFSEFNLQGDLIWRQSKLFIFVVGKNDGPIWNFRADKNDR